MAYVDREWYRSGCWFHGVTSERTPDMITMDHMWLLSFIELQHLIIQNNRASYLSVRHSDPLLLHYSLQFFLSLYGDDVCESA